MRRNTSDIAFASLELNDMREHIISIFSNSNEIQATSKGLYFLVKTASTGSSRANCGLS